MGNVYIGAISTLSLFTVILVLIADLMLKRWQLQTTNSSHIFELHLAGTHKANAKGYNCKWNLRFARTIAILAKGE